MDKYVGKAIKRLEDPRLLQGMGQYVDDIRMPGMLHARFLRSPWAHARIRSVDTSKAAKHPGVYMVLAGREALKYSHTWNNHLAPMEESFYPLAHDKVLYVGHEVAVVLAEDPVDAEDALELIEVDYEVLPALIDPEEAMKDGAPSIREDVKGAKNNVSFHYKLTAGDVETAFKQADKIVEDRFVTAEHHVAPLEPSAVIASFDRGRDTVTVWAPNQTPFNLRRSLSEALQIPESHIHVIVPDMGGGFGARIGPYPHYVVPSILSRITDRPVKIVLDRREDLLATAHRNRSVIYLSMAFKNDGRIIGVKGRVIWDSGATHGFSSSNMSKGVLQLPGPYKIEHVHIEGFCVYTNKATTGPNRGFGQPQTVFARERLLDIAAKKLGIDPLELRLRNVLKANEVPYRSSVGPVFDSACFVDCLKSAAEAVGWKKVLSERKPYVGVGIALYQKNNGGFHFNNFADYDSARVEVTRTGSILVASSALPHGQGHETFMAQIIADKLGVEMDKIAFTFGDTEKCPPGLGTWGSRTVVISGGALHMACDKISEKMKAIAAHNLEARKEDIEFSDGKFFVRGTPTISMSFMNVVDLAYTAPQSLPAGMEPTLYATATYDPPGKSRGYDENGRSQVASSYDIGAYAALVQVDPETGDFKILDHALAYDCGKVVNPLIVDGQHHGGIAHGIGMAMYENMIWNDAGEPLNASFADFLCTSPLEMDPSVKIIRFESPPAFIGTGYRGVGESSLIPVPAALANAVSNALKTEFNELPLLPEKIRQTLRSKV